MTTPSTTEPQPLPPDTDNPMEFLRWISTLPVEQRDAHLKRWLDLVDARPAIEWGALVKKGSRVFGYLIATRRYVDACKKAGWRVIEDQ